MCACASVILAIAKREYPTFEASAYSEFILEQKESARCTIASSLHATILPKSQKCVCKLSGSARPGLGMAHGRDGGAWVGEPRARGTKRDRRGTEEVPPGATEASCACGQIERHVIQGAARSTEHTLMYARTHVYTCTQPHATDRVVSISVFLFSLLSLCGIPVSVHN